MMAGVGVGGRRRRDATVAVVFLLTCVSQCVSGAVTSPPTPTPPVCRHDEFLSDKNICCNRCFPGFKLEKSCQAENHRSVCVPCPDKEYMEHNNYHKNCFSCLTCPASKHKEEVSPCRSYQNTVCRCQAGFYRVNISVDTFECRRCKKCGGDERQSSACTREKNTECVCKENHYRVQKRCTLCRNCSSDCSHLCSSPPPPSPPPPPPHSSEGRHPRDTSLINVIIGCVIVGVALVLLVAMVTHLVTKRRAHKELLSRQTDAASSDESPETIKEVLITNEVPALTNQSSAPQQEVPNLPDCIPLEIKMSDLIYSVLDAVPVLRVKQLVRSLGVKDSLIEQAELDYRPSREAHYQMLRLWAEQQRGRSGTGGGGTGGGGSLLHRPLVEELLERLTDMQLIQAVEELQNKYAIQ